MKGMHHSASFRTIALLSMVTMLLSACTSWQPISLESGAVPNKVRVTTRSERVVLKDARLVGDTAVVGLWRDRSRRVRAPRSIRLIDVLRVERGKTDYLRTTGLIAASIVVGFYALFAISCVGSDDFVCGGE